MLFTGHSEHSIDSKLRLAIPAKYRNQWSTDRDGAAWICIPWPSGHLRLYTERAFSRMADQGEMSLTPDAATSELEASLYGFAERLEMDAAGRITLPREHLEMTGLRGGGVAASEHARGGGEGAREGGSAGGGGMEGGIEVMVVGARNRLEVRAKSDWQATAMDRFRSLPGLVQRVQKKKGEGGTE